MKSSLVLQNLSQFYILLQLSEIIKRLISKQLNYLPDQGMYYIKSKCHWYLYHDLDFGFK